MGTKTHNNYEDLITFTRATAGHALRPLSYGSELVTNGDGSSVTNWDSPRSNSTLSVNSGRLRSTASASGAYGIAQTLSNLTVGAIYFYSANIYADGGSGNMIFRISALSTLDNQPVSDEQSTTRLVSGSFVATASTMYVGGIHVASSAGDYIELDNVSIKEVTFDESDGTLTLFEHPNNVPRVEYDADGNRLGLLVEEARTNLIANSDFDAGVSQSSVTITANASESPDGLQNATSLDLTANGGFAYFTVPVAAGTKYTWSWFAKAGTATAHVYAVYDITNATFVSREEYTLTSGQNYGNGWYRHTETFTAPTGCTEVRVYAVRGTTNTGSPAGVLGTTFVWGGQLEADAFASSIIRTTGATATRSADVASMNLSEFGYNHDKGTVVVEASFTIDPNGSSFPRMLEFNTGTSSIDRTLIFASESSNTLQASSFVNSVSQVAMQVQTAPLTSSVNAKVAYAFETDNFAASNDGNTVVTDTSGFFEPSVKRNKLTFGGSGANASNNMNGHIKSFKYYPRRLTNAQLEDLSS